MLLVIDFVLLLLFLVGGSTLLLPVPDERLKQCIKILELTNIEIAEAFDKFCKHDKSRRGCLPLATVYKMLSERKSIFGDSVFELVGIADYQELTFSEWISSVTTYCLFEEEDILKFCFYILDRQKNGYIEQEEMRILIYMLYHIDPVKGPTGNTKLAFEKLPIQRDGKIEFWEFELFHQAFPALLYPAFRLQLKMMQAVWGERWWSQRKRQLQDNLEARRKQEEHERMAESRRLEEMRQRRIRRKMGTCKYHCWPCGRAQYDKMFPVPQVHVLTPQEQEAERLRQEAEAKAELKRVMDSNFLYPETEEYKRYRAKVETRREKEKKEKDKKRKHPQDEPAPPARRPVSREQLESHRRLRLENRRLRDGRLPDEGAFD